MAERTESSIRVESSPDDVMSVIANFEAYPEWTGAVKEVEVQTRDAQGRADHVRFRLDAGAIKDTYVLGYQWEGVRAVRWSLVEAQQLLRSMDGAYLLADNGDGTTTVTYQLAVEVKMPLLGMMKRKAEKVIVDTALNELKKRVEG